MTEEEVRRLLVEHGALLRGHFRLTSGRHSDLYVEKARVLEHPDVVLRFANQIASWHDDVEVIVSPAVGAIPLGFAVALESGARFVYAERESDRMTLRRGFRLHSGERTLVVEDVVTTGGSAAEVHALVGDQGAHALGVAALVDRSTEQLDFPLRALVKIEGRTFDPSSCPLCADGTPIEEHGSRRL